MGYCTAQYMINRFGAAEMAGLSSLDDQPIPSADAFRIANEPSPEWPEYISEEEQVIALAGVVRCSSAISAASNEMDSYLSKFYRLPISQVVVTNSLLPEICANLARYYLADDRITAELNDRAIFARSWLKDVADGKTYIPNADKSVGLSTSYPNIEIGYTFFSDGLLDSYA